MCFTPKAAAAANINIMLTSFIWKTVQNYTYSKCGAYHLRKMLVALSKNFSGPEMKLLNCENFFNGKPIDERRAALHSIGIMVENGESRFEPRVEI